MHGWRKELINAVKIPDRAKIFGTNSGDFCQNLRINPNLGSVYQGGIFSQDSAMVNYLKVTGFFWRTGNDRMRFYPK